jgi:hypothetical protein
MISAALSCHDREVAYATGAIRKGNQRFARQMGVLRAALVCAFTVCFLAAAPACCAAAVPFTDGTSGGATGRAFVTYCESTNDGTAATLSRELGGCQRKLVIDLTLDDSTVAGSVLETFVVVTEALHRAAFPKTEMPPAAEDASTTATTLQVTLPPIRVGFRRGGVQMRYGLTYLREFPAALRDYVQPLRTATTCDDGVTRCPAYTPVAVNGGDNSVVAAPLGVCCLCTGVECALSSDLCNASMRAYFCFRTAAAGTICVKEDGVRYSGWSIGVGFPYYTLNTSVSGPGVVSTSTFQLTTDNTDIMSGGTSRMQLLRTSGVDTAEAGRRLNVTQRVLFNPLSGDRATAGASEWMLVPTSLVTVDGTACNKVGVTPEYFYGLSSFSQCNAQSGTCLANQLEDLRTADVATVAHGGGGSYLATYLGSFTQQTIGSKRYLLDEVERSGGATLRWSTNADAFTFTPVPVDGRLVAATYVSGTAQMSIVVSNTNAYAGFYYVAVRNCSSTTRVLNCSGDHNGLTRECATSLLVRGNNTSASLFQTWSAAENVGGTANCTVELLDAANTTLDTASVVWTVETTTTTTAAPLSKSQRCARCPFHDLRCLFSGVCEWKMLVWTVVALAVTWSPYAILAYWRVAWQLCRK